MPFGSGTHTLSMWHHVNHCLDLYEHDTNFSFIFFWGLKVARAEMHVIFFPDGG